MIKKFSSQTIFSYFVRSCLILLCIGISSFCITYLGKEHPVKQDFVGSGVIEEMTKDLYNTKYAIKFPKQPPISVTKEVYYKYEVGDRIALYRDNDKDQEIKMLITIVVNLAFIFSASYVAFNFFLLCGLCRSFFYWGCNHSNTQTFEEYLKEQKSK